MNRDARFAELDAAIAGDAALARWREQEAVREIVMRPRLLMTWNPKPFAMPTKRPYRINWRARRERYLVETGRVEGGIQSVC